MVKYILLMLIFVSVGYSQEYPFPVGEFNAIINYDGVAETDFWLRSILNNNGQRTFDDPRPIYVDESYVEQYGVGAGGWAYALGWYDNENVFVGTDISGIYKSSNGGDSWDQHMEGIYDSDRLNLHYTRYVTDLQKVDNSFFSGMFASLYGGIFKRSISGDNVWEPVTPNNLGYY